MQRMCSQQWEWRSEGAGARAQPSIPVTHCASPASWTLTNSFQVSFWTFSLLSQPVPLLLPDGAANLRKQRDWKEAEKGAWQRRLGRGEVWGLIRALPESRGLFDAVDPEPAPGR